MNSVKSTFLVPLKALKIGKLYQTTTFVTFSPVIEKDFGLIDDMELLNNIVLKKNEVVMLIEISSSSMFTNLIFLYGEKLIFLSFLNFQPPGSACEEIHINFSKLALVEK